MTLTVEHLLKIYKRKTGTVITRQDFMKLWSLFVNQFHTELLEGNQINLPIGSFYICEVIIRKRKEGKDKPINWAGTWDLWKEYPELRGKQYVRFLHGYKFPFYSIIWSKQRLPKFNSKHFIQFKAPHKIRRALFEAVENGKEYL